MNVHRKESESTIEFANPNSYIDWLSAVSEGTSRSLETKTIDGLGLRVNNPESLRKFIDHGQNKPALVVLSGTSESGKSHTGKSFLKEGWGHRIKFVNAVDKFLSNNEIESSPLDYLNNLENIEQQQELVSDFLIQFDAIRGESDLHVGVVETIKHPWIVTHLQQQEEVRVLSLFIDAPFTSRVLRESLRTGKRNDEVISEIILKDKQKSIMGNDSLADSATLYVNNAGSLASFNALLSAISTLSLADKEPKPDSAIEYLDPTK